eukprot:509350-Rhodomonas_salina.1
MRLHTLTPSAAHCLLVLGLLPPVPTPDSLREVLEVTNLVGQLLPVVYLTLLCLGVCSSQVHNLPQSLDRPLSLLRGGSVSGPGSVKSGSFPNLESTVGK